VRSGVNPNGTSAHKFVGNLGHPSDNNTGLIYMQARYIDPATGRFVSEYPGRHGSEWFAYCGDNPASNIDADGSWKSLFMTDVFAILGTALVFAAYITTSVVAAIAFAGAASWCFAFSTLGLDASQNLGIVFAIPGGLQNLQTVIAATAKEETAAKYNIAFVAPTILICCTEDLVLCGMIASIGADAGN